jgi:hypothetical protein
MVPPHDYVKYNTFVTFYACLVSILSLSFHIIFLLTSTGQTGKPISMVEGRGLSRSRRAAAAENFTTPPPPKNACRRAAAADVLFGAPPKRYRHVLFSISCSTSIAIVAYC